ncbi:hypothetical protein KCP78_16340 [Salmonella enterica subsp. enterica]|nr:hypothetical protein KCP78_16340 [Salmonella enterica subsp. enterica]
MRSSAPVKRDSGSRQQTGAYLTTTSLMSSGSSPTAHPGFMVPPGINTANLSPLAA